MSGSPTEHTARHQDGAGGGGSGTLLPGAVLGAGRYRLLAQAGSDARAGAGLWRARDGQLKRDVALTVLLGDPADPAAAGRARRTLERAMHAASFVHPGVARVLDVLSPGNGVKPTEGILGMVVAEWTQGTDLVDLVADGPLPHATTCRLLEPLAAAVEGAHHAGLVLGTDHPQRIRVTADGRLRLAFPGPLPDAVAQDDVRGLGAVLYLLLTGRWALPGGPEGLPAAPQGPGGSVVAPRSLQPAVPHALSSVAVRSLENTSVGGIRTSAAILQVLAEVAEAELQATQPHQISDDPEDEVVWTTRKPVRDPEQQRKLMIGVVALVVATLVVIAWLGISVINFFSDSPAQGGPPLVVSPTTPPPSPPPTSAPPPTTSPSAAAGPVRPSGIVVYSPDGDPDSPNRARLAIDGNPGTVWKTDNYFQNFPALKSGIGLMVSFPTAVRLAAVTVTSPSQGATVEIRTAPSDNADLDQTQVIGSAPLGAGDTRIPVNMPAPGQRVLIWITSLGGGGRSFQAAIAELVFQPA
ncbi:protein kinase family protein [Gandjariella thermophila]|uniref:Membrane protein n=1 Tax=Gandjariella thermophila TaxID=1931992 RepID=A0A4D4J7D8_9PSEU|nr:protein kinase family protein [Gandjariella thermophila]GDY30920.1 membrane protein [Gandjariella thermophila]